jgi:hypothetical protein
MEQKLHKMLLSDAHPDMTAHELYTIANKIITDNGFENLDYRGNLGHTIENHKDDRRYTEANNQAPLGQFGMFTFEPHIRQAGGTYGFKHENIYYFADGRLKAL